MAKAKVNPKEAIQAAVGEMRDLLEQMTEDWEKYYYDNTKKGGKMARKATLAIKKKCAEIRILFRELEL